jgi:very-short-patch-repair endonuclease
MILRGKNEMESVLAEKIKNSCTISEFYTRKALQNAKELRKNKTNAESVLWYHLKNKQLERYKFKRQQPIDKYVVDFVCFKRKLVIELDGNQHGYVKNKEYDRKRTKFLNTLGYRVIRFSNTDVLLNINVVLETIYACLNDIELVDRINSSLDTVINQDIRENLNVPLKKEWR